MTRPLQGIHSFQPDNERMKDEDRKDIWGILIVRVHESERNEIHFV